MTKCLSMKDALGLPRGPPEAPLPAPLRKLDWYERVIVPKTPRSAKVKLSVIGYWRKSSFADWSLVSLHPWDLLEWRREVQQADSRGGG